MKFISKISLFLSIFLFLIHVPVFAQGGMDLPIVSSLVATPKEDPPLDPAEEDDPPKIYDEEIAARTNSIIYVLDCSGSMALPCEPYIDSTGNVAYGTRLDRAKSELVASINSLSEDFNFNVIAYACDVRQWQIATRKAEYVNKVSAIAWVQALWADGGTGTGPAVVLALHDETNFTIVLLSDGAPGCGELNAISVHFEMIRAHNTHGVVIHCFGIGAFGAFEQFLRNVASSTGGRYRSV